MTLAESAAYLRSTGLYSEREIRERVERIATRKTLEALARIPNLHQTLVRTLKETTVNLPGYDAWKTDSGYEERSSAEEDLAELQAENERLLKALNHVQDWLNDRSDVDHDDYGNSIPNEENRLLGEIDQIVKLGKVL